ncbi:TIR domain-containing protein [Arcobacter venerupis]|uniref:TIR domain-containing protein n=1 Tax=Arcobacter venerupis TaxID=1054033 RepID=A0AAE7B8I2_9BACT|nr:toll/interleukin-1 receptor domain-containing protein [Arcobacter venerupis]QKF66561.1 TIR domain-containing protein [Arcobacter venerupis]RWS49702.1 molecular chaperone Tir [Arcobacter venerupis]
MSISTISNSITNIQKEISDLHYKMSLETKKEVDCNNRIGQIERSITKNTSLSTLNSKNAEIQRKQSEISKIQIKKADLYKKISDKDGKLLKLKQDLAKEEEQERKKQIANEEKKRKKLLDLEKRQQKEQLAFQKQLQLEIQNTNNISVVINHKNENSKTAINKSILSIEYDLFISHASEDKDEIVRPLAEELQKLGVKVWYDEFTLKVGDSLRKSIDHGLLKSKYGTVILSSTFCSKSWTQYEFDSMITREMNGHKMILPIWHKVTKNDVINFSPALADKVALNTSLNSIEEIAKQLSEVILEV